MDSNRDGLANEIDKYIYDGEHVVFDFVDPDGTGAAPMALKNRYLYGAAVDQILAQEDATVSPSDPAHVLWFLGDNQNTTRDLVDNSGATITGGHFTYSGFGAVTSGDTSLSRYLYTGRELDALTGLQYNRNRWYDADSGRWISEDPIGFRGGDPNLYRYGGNSPTNATDPTGMFAEIAAGGIWAWLGGIGGTIGSLTPPGWFIWGGIAVGAAGVGIWYFWSPSDVPGEGPNPDLPPGLCDLEIKSLLTLTDISDWEISKEMAEEALDNIWSQIDALENMVDAGDTSVLLDLSAAYNKAKELLKNLNDIEDYLKDKKSKADKKCSN